MKCYNKGLKKIITIAILIIFFLGNMIRSIDTIAIENKENSYKNIILLIDKSGSMKKNDPNRLSILAAQMFLDMINEKDTKVNVITFGDTEKVNFLGNINENINFDNLKEFLLNIKFEDNYTDLKSGLEEAINQLNGVDGKKQLILLTDGKETIEGGITEDYKNDIKKLLEKAMKESIVIDSIGLSEEVDKDRLLELSNKTKGDFYFSKSAGELINVFSNIVGHDKEFLVLDNYSTEIKLNEKISFNKAIEEVVISIASYGNEAPKTKVLVDNKEINPEKYGELYDIYSLKSGVVEIISDKKSKENITIQIKAKPILKIINEDEFIKSSKKIPISLEMAIENYDSQISGLYIEKYIDGNLDKKINKTNDKIVDNFTITESGKYLIRYVAKNGNGEIVTVNEFNMNIEDNPPFYYKNEINNLKKDDILEVKLIPLENSIVKDLGGTLNIEYEDGTKEEVTMVVENGILTGNISIKNIGLVKYNAFVNGKGFSYRLPSKKVNIIDKELIELEISNNEIKLFKLGNSVNLDINLKKCNVYEEFIIEILDNKNNKLGNIIVDSNDKDGIVKSIQLTPLQEGTYKYLNLKANKDILINEKLQCNLKVLKSINYYFEKFKFLIIALSILIIGIIVMTIIGFYSYKTIENYTKKIILKCKNNSEVSYKTLLIDLSIENSRKFIIYNYLTKQFKISKNREKTTVGIIELRTYKNNFIENNNSLISKIKSGIYYFILKERKYFNIYYMPILKGQRNEIGTNIIGEEKYENIKKIVLNNLGDEIEIILK
ncbi:VWA domain-containing protein [Clostridium tarantellae]|uniref:VWA domain-containing protein n=1 Tax=Clostridium tarantellae TaxID=39493 RepID=UPI0014781B95|nr:vWA domain-containing protein [Clostridium tarantellae]